MDHKLLSVVGMFCFVLYQTSPVLSACNEAVCASLVSKCMLLKACECNMQDKTNCTCCKDCHKCLAALYTQCCACVGMCSKASIKDNTMKSSTVEQLEEPIPGLFTVLTDEPDHLQRWTTYTYPAHLDLLYFKPRSKDGETVVMDLTGDEDTKGEATIRHGHHKVTFDKTTEYQNCTVAYMAKCMSLGNCREACHSMGAARYRWFHEHACCECIGTTCLDYGKGEPMCLQCPPADDYDAYDYENNFEDDSELDARGKKKKVPTATLR